MSVMAPLNAFALLALLTQHSDGARETVIYRCTDATGTLALQSMPCPPGSEQTIRRVAADYSPPSPASTAHHVDETIATIPEVIDAPPAIAPSPLQTLPVLHHCQPRRGAPYYTHHLEESVRCIPLQITGLDGSVDSAAGEACEVQRDACHSVPAEQACQAWDAYWQQSQQHPAASAVHDSRKGEVRSRQIAALLATSGCQTASTGTDQNP